MLIRWEKLHHFDGVFMGVTVPYTNLRLAAQTLYGPVELKLKIAWDVPQSSFAVFNPELAQHSTVLRNYCRSFKVVLPLEPNCGLSTTTLDYFDGDDRTAATKRDCTILFCARKWRQSATRAANRYGTERQQNLVSVCDFMLRRVRNAYSAIS